MGLRIYSTQTGEKSDFTPIEPGKVRMYVCGVTPYAPSHIGHARCYVAFDVIFRWLRRHYDVTYVRNFTDVDDKIIKAGNAAGEDPIALAARFIRQYHEDMGALGLAAPHHEPKVSETIPEIIAIIETLIARGHAYPAEGDVYFDVPSFPAYGALSRRTQEDLEDLEAGARVEVDPRKKSPRDFALWKAAKPGEPSWDSPWGKGRPGWHIECSAMSAKFLGETFDLHGGGKDLVFPHHENEVAQSCAASGKPVLARYWLHNGFVNLLPEQCPECGGELPASAAPGCAPEKCAGCGYVLSEADLKMSKSRGNFYPIGEVIGLVEAEALRLFLLTCHYRSPIAFSHTRLSETERRLDKMYETLDGIERFTAENAAKEGPSFGELFKVDAGAAFAEALDDDFNTAKALADLGEVFKIANDVLHGIEKERLGKGLSPGDKARVLGQARDVLRDTGEVLGLWQQPARAYLERRRAVRVKGLGISEQEIEALIAERTTARANKDWKRSDELRDVLKERGVAVKDSKTGTVWEVAD